MNNHDISVFITWFIDMFLDIWQWIWDMFKSIKFNGTSLYYIIIIIIVLRVSVPLLVQLHEEGKSNEIKIERSKHNGRK